MTVADLYARDEGGNESEHVGGLYGFGREAGRCGAEGVARSCSQREVALRDMQVMTMVRVTSVEIAEEAPDALGREVGL